MAWLPSHQDLRDHPKLRKATVLLGVPRAQVIGHLHCLWWWALSYADDGDLSNYDNTDIALAAEWDGDPGVFVDALLDCGAGGKHGFLERTDDGIVLHDWPEYGGKYVEKRKRDAARKREGGGSSDADPAPPDTPSDPPPSDVQRSSDGPPSEVAGREERGDRGEKKDPPSLSLVDSDGFADFWRAYPKKADKQLAEKAWKAAIKRGVSPSLLVSRAAAYADDPTRKREFTKNPATWLNAGSYENETSAYEPTKVRYT